MRSSSSGDAASSVTTSAISAISQTPASYRQNHKTLGAYYEALDRGEAPVSRGLELTPEDARRRDLIKAGALIVAEIERIDRAAQEATDAEV